MSGEESKQENKDKVDEPRRITQAEWLAELKERFGGDTKKWAFVCPNCKHVQGVEDFLELKELGIYTRDRLPEDVYRSCIGRFDTRIPEKKLGTLGDGKSPCDYTMGGLFPFCHTMVISSDGKEHQVFEIAGDGVGV